MASINRGDNTGAFGNDFLRIYLNNPNQLYIQKALIQINGDLEKEYFEPIFPLRVNFTGAETEMLHQVNVCKLALWDEFGRRRTADGKFTFFCKENRINSPDAPLYDGTEIYPEENAVTFDITDAEFAAQFIVNATPAKMSELQQDIPLMTPDKIIGGINIRTQIEGDSVIINAELDSKQSYNDLDDKPSINGIELIGNMDLETQVNADWKATEGKAQILNKPTFASVAYSGNYNDIVGTPSIPKKVSDLTNDLGFVDRDKIADYYTKEQVDQIIIEHAELQPVYDKINELSEKEQNDIDTLSSEINTKASITSLNSAVGSLQNKDALLTENINTLQGKITNLSIELDTKAPNTQVQEIAVELSEKASKNELNYAVSNLASKTDLLNGLNSKLNKTALGNGKLTILKNSETAGVFYANNPTDVEINLTVPVKTSELINDSNYVTAEDISIDNYVTDAEFLDGLNKKVDKTALGEGILTIKVNDATLGSFNANSSMSKIINIPVPIKLSDIEQDIPYLKSEDLEDLTTTVNYLSQSEASTQNRLSGIEVNLLNKVDKRNGYSLISNAEIERLSAVTNYDDTDIKDTLEIISEKVDHYDLQIDNKVDKIEGKGLSTNDYITDDKNQIYIDKRRIDNLNTDVTSLKDDLLTTKQTLTTLDDTVELYHTNLTNELNNETTNRLNGDNALQSQIDALQAKSSVVDILATLADLSTYDRTKLKEDDVICILKDESHNNTVSYYRWKNSDFLYIGSEGSHYTKSEADARFISSSVEINGYPITSDINLNYADVHALPENTVIGNGTISIQIKDLHNTDDTTNRTTIGSFSLNQTDSDIVVINMPTDISDLTNEDNYITKDVLLDEYLGRDIPYNTLIQDEIDTLNLKVAALEGGLPTVALTGVYYDLKELPTKISENYKRIKKDESYTDYIDDTFLEELKVKSGYLTAEDITEEFALKSEIPVHVSQLENDRGYITMSAVGRADLTIKLPNEELGTFNANSKENITIEIPVDSSMSDTSLHPVENRTVKAYVDDLDSRVVHLTGNENVAGIKTINNLVTSTQNISDKSTKAATTAFVDNYYTNKDQYLVHLAGNENITGDKTFTGFVQLNAANGITMATSDNSTKLATTAYVKNQNYALDSTVVHLNSAEIINGNKTFAETTTFQGITYLGDYAHVNTDSSENDCPANVLYVNNQISTLSSDVDTRIVTAKTNLSSEIDTKITTAKTEILTTVTTALEDYYLKTEVDDLISTKDSEISALQALITDLTTRVENLEAAVIPPENSEPDSGN